MLLPRVHQAKKTELPGCDHYLSKDRLTFEHDRQRMHKRTDRRKSKNSGKCRCPCCRGSRPGETLRKGSVNFRWLTSFDKTSELDDTVDDGEMVESGMVENESRVQRFEFRVTLLDIAQPARPTKLKGLAKDFVMIPSLPRVQEIDWGDVVVDDWEML